MKGFNIIILGKIGASAEANIGINNSKLELESTQPFFLNSSSPLPKITHFNDNRLYNERCFYTSPLPILHKSFKLETTGFKKLLIKLYASIVKKTINITKVIIIISSRK